MMHEVNYNPSSLIIHLDKCLLVFRNYKSLFYDRETRQKRIAEPKCQSMTDALEKARNSLTDDKYIVCAKCDMNKCGQ